MTEPTWVDCDACSGEGIQLDEDDLDIDCPECEGDGGWEYAAPSRNEACAAAGCVDCRSS